VSSLTVVFSVTLRAATPAVAMELASFSRAFSAFLASTPSSFFIFFACDLELGSLASLTGPLEGPVLLSMEGSRVFDGTPRQSSGRCVMKCSSISSVTLARRS